MHSRQPSLSDRLLCNLPFSSSSLILFNLGAGCPAVENNENVVNCLHITFVQWWTPARSGPQGVKRVKSAFEPNGPSGQHLSLVSVA